MSDRLVQTAAALTAAAAFTGAAWLSPGIDRQRRECKMAYEPSGSGTGNDAVYRLIENLGALRGIAINLLWNQLENQKQAGHHHDADATARCITGLQPRMPEVWRYMAFNLAYNVSVKCQTQEERWAWINRGIRILKDEGIPNNPGAEPLYRELAWIYQHKIGGETDDMNRYFKKRTADTWQAILGVPPMGRQPKAGGAAGETEDIVTAQMRLVAKAAGEAYATLADGSRAGSVAPARRDAFLAAHPDAAHAVAQVDAACRAAGEPEPGMSADLGLAVGRLLSYGDYVRMAEDASFGELSKSLDARLGGQGRAVLSVLRSDARARAGIDQMLPWLRAMVIVEREKMDPSVMLAMMEEYGPMDWRHPHAHAMYWSLLGSKKAERPDYLTEVNTDRSMVAGVQGLMHSGRVFYDPVEDFLSDQPDPRFIEAYGRAQQLMRDKAARGVYSTSEGVMRSLDRGEESFLHSAIQVSYLFGDEKEAHKYYRRVKEKFPQSEVYAKYYGLTLPDFVVVTIREDRLRVVQEAALAGLMSRGLEAAFLQHDAARAQTLFKMAAATRAGIEKDHAEAVRTATGTDDARRPVPTLAQLQEQALRRFMTDPGHTLRQRAAVWEQLPVPAKLALFDEVERAVYPQVKATGLPIAPQVYFPPPEGLAEFRKQRSGQEGPGILAPDRK